VEISVDWTEDFTFNDPMTHPTLAILACATVVAFAPAPAEAEPRILYVGDSISVETADVVAWWTWNSVGATTTRAMFGGLAICDFTEGRESPTATESTLKARVKRDRPDLVVLQFVGNRFTSCMQNLPDDDAYYAKYRSDALAVAQQISEAAVEASIARPEILWVLQGPSEGSRHTARMNAQYREVARLTGGHTTDAGYEVSKAAFPGADYATQRDEFTRFVPCSDFEKLAGYCTDLANNLARVRKDNDSVHYCLGVMNGFDCSEKSPGILRYGMRIAADAARLLRSAAP
jgi:hypothetical protein